MDSEDSRWHGQIVCVLGQVLNISELSFIICKVGATATFLVAYIYLEVPTSDTTGL